MLWSASELIGYKVTTDHEKVGKVYDFLFDDVEWRTRYLVLDIGPWLVKRLVVIEPGFARQPNLTHRILSVTLTKAQIRNSPRLEAYRSVYRYRQVDSYVSPMAFGMGMGGALLVHRRGPPPDKGDPHLRSMKEVIAYHVVATNGDIGYVDEFIIDDHGWGIRHIVVVQMQDSAVVRKVAVSPKSVRELRWKEERVYVELSREDIEKTPEYSVE